MRKHSAKPDAAEPLLQEFQIPTLEQWHEEVVRLLKGAPFEKKMLTELLEGITLQPMYTQEDVKELFEGNSLPGQAPFLRSSSAAGYYSKTWDIAQEIPIPHPKEFNRVLRDDLIRGQNAVALVLDDASQAGLDPSHIKHGRVGYKGTSITAYDDFRAALDGVDLETNPIFIESGSAALPAYAMLLGFLRETKQNPAKLRGTVGMDPIAGLARHGTLPLPIDVAWNELALINSYASEHTPGLKTFPIHGSVWHNAGGSAVQELAFSIASAVTVLREMAARNLPLDRVAASFSFRIAVGSNFFLEISKLRALRLLWHRVLEASGVGESATAMTLHVKTGRYNKTQFDPHVNILRGTVEAFAAIMGGANAIHVDPFDQPLGLPSDLSRRLARNTQLVLRDESHFDHVIDPAGGSWYVERLTHDLAEKAWTLFQEVESKGGIVELLNSNWIQQEVNKVELKRRQNLQFRKDALVGTTHYPNPVEGLPKNNRPDYDAVHLSRAKEVKERRASAGNAADASLARLLATTGIETIDQTIEALLNGATLGELTHALGHAVDSSPTALTVLTQPARRAAAQFEELRKEVLTWREKNPGAPVQVFLACMGPQGKYMPRLDFTRSFFNAGGFSIEGDKSFGSASDATEAFTKAQAPLVVIVGTDDTYADVVPELAKLLKGLDKKPLVVLAGYPADKLEEYKAAGVDEFIHIKSDLLKTLQNFAEAMGVRA